MDTPNYLIFPPGHPEQFRWTQKARQELGPRFARRGINIDELRTGEEINDAVAKVIVFEINVLTPEQRADNACLRPIFDLQFVADPPFDIPPQPLAERRASPLAAMQWAVSPRPAQSPRPTENPVDIFGEMWQALKRLWAAL